jgi:hypothetical protein
MDVGSSKTTGQIASFFDWIPQSRDVFEKVKAAAEGATEAVQTTCTTTFDSAAALNAKLIEAGRSNSNAALEFARTAMAVTSPLEFSHLMTAYVRKQFELWVEQTTEFSDLVQKVTRETVSNGASKAFKRAA